MRDLKRRFSAMVDKTESVERSPHPEKQLQDALLLPLTGESDKEQLKTLALTTQPSLSLPAQELVKLIPSLTGVDVSNLVASTKRRKKEQCRADKAP